MFLEKEKDAENPPKESVLLPPHLAEVKGLVIKAVRQVRIVTRITIVVKVPIEKGRVSLDPNENGPLVQGHPEIILKVFVEICMMVVTRLASLEWSHEGNLPLGKRIAPHVFLF